MPHLGSWRKRCLISHEKAQKAQKGQKNGQKVLYKQINSAVLQAAEEGFFINRGYLWHKLRGLTLICFSRLWRPV